MTPLRRAADLARLALRPGDRQAMNTNGLARHYDTLTPRERLPLIMAASARGDAVERDRLARSAPREHFSLPDYHGLAEGVLLAALLRGLAVLELAARFRQCEGLDGQYA